MYWNKWDFWLRIPTTGEVLQIPTSQKIFDEDSQQWSPRRPGKIDGKLTQGTFNLNQLIKFRITPTLCASRKCAHLDDSWRRWAASNDLGSAVLAISICISDADEGGMENDWCSAWSCRLWSAALGSTSSVDGAGYISRISYQSIAIWAHEYCRRAITLSRLLWRADCAKR